MLMNSTAASAQVQGPFAQPDAPQVKLTNGVLHLTVYTPDAAKGFYRGTRFDWAGVIGHLDYAGHSYYGPWFTKTAPGVDDFSIQDSGVVAGPSSAIVGPVEEFFTREKALGFDEAAPGGTFIKIGVGVLRRPDNRDYTSYIQYPIVDGGKRSVQVHSSSITFTQDVMDPASGYGYHYVKTVRLVQGKPQMVIEHTLTSTGKHEIESDVFDHNFLSLDELPIGPAYSITLPFNIQLKHVYGLGLASIDGHRILYKKVLEGQDCFATVMRGFGTTASDYDVKIENTQAHAGLRINGDKPLQSIEIWSIRSVLAVEPYVHIDIKPGESFTWHYTYTYFTMQ